MVLVEARRGRTRALLAGVPRFDRAGLPDVPGLHRAPFEVRAALTGRDGGGVFRTRDVRVALPDTAADLWDSLSWAVAGGERLDLLLVHYTGPAELYTELRGGPQLFLTVSRWTDGEPVRTALAVHHLIDALRDCGARQVALVLDCPSAASALNETGRWTRPFHMIASTPAGQDVRWLDSAPGGRTVGQRLPVFTRRLVRALLPSRDSQAVTMELVVERLRRYAARAGDGRAPWVRAERGGSGIVVNRKAMWGDSGSWALPAEGVPLSAEPEVEPADPPSWASGLTAGAWVEGAAVEGPEPVPGDPGSAPGPPHVGGPAAEPGAVGAPGPGPDGGAGPSVPDPPAGPPRAEGPPKPPLPRSEPGDGRGRARG